MTFSDYQKVAMQTDRLNYSGNDPLIVALLGLAGEVGSLHTMFKKQARDGEQFEGFEARVTEELGDILWYLAAIAHHQGLSLQAIASENIQKTTNRWLPPDEDGSDFDEHFPESEQLPRSFVAEFREMVVQDRPHVEVLVDGEKCGSTLNDNAYESDGYRLHDIFHMTCAALLGWSPVMRALLKRKRKSDQEIDMVEDGGRAIVVDEALAAVVFAYANRHTLLASIKTLDWPLLDLCVELTQGFEVSKRTRWEWENAILRAFEVWRHVKDKKGGTVLFDRANKAVEIRS